MSRLRSPLACTAAFIPLLVGCSGTHAVHEDQADTAEWQSQFDVAPGDWASHGTNPWFVLEPGYRLVLRPMNSQKHDELVVNVLDKTEMVDGVETRVVEERESSDGELEEVSRNFFAISKSTHDVYYFGEEVDIYEGGKAAKHEGAWRSGEHGAKFGLFLPNEPRVGQRFYQEVAPHVAMDRCEVVSTDATFETPAGRFEHCLKLEETTPIEPGTKEHKHFARGIGLVQDGHLLLTSYGMPKTGR